MNVVDWTMPNADYHDASPLSHSDLEVFRKNPALWKAQQEGRVTRERTDDFDFGAAFHAIMSEDDSVFIEIPDSALSASGSRSGQKWKDFVSQNPGKILLKRGGEHGTNKLRMMADAIQDHPSAALILKRGNGDLRRHEVSLFFDRQTDAGEPIECKARPDVILFDKDGDDGLKPQFLIDWKTTSDSDPEAFAQAGWRFGYHRQAAWYLDAAKACWPGCNPKFLFVSVEKADVFRVEVHEPSEMLLAIGREQNAELVHQFAACVRQGIWQPRTFGIINQMQPPAWAVKRSFSQFELEQAV